MNIVVLTANNSFVNYLIGRVDEALTVSKVVRVKVAGKREAKRQRFLKLFSAKICYNLEQKLFYRPLLARQDTEVTRRLAASELLRRQPPSLEIAASDLNSPETAAKIRELQPDILLVCSAPLLKPEIFTIPRIATLNVHFGIAPAYRGENTLFWPLYFRDYKNIGVTIHRINPGIDAGPIVAQGTVSVEPSDDTVSLFVKLMKLATDLTIDLLSSGDQGCLDGIPQTEKGRLFLYRSRRIWHDAYLFVRSLLQLDKLPHLQEHRWRNVESPSHEELVAQ